MKKETATSAKPTSHLVHSSELMSKALHVGNVAPWDTQPTEQIKPKEKIPHLSEHSKPPTIKAATHQTKGLTMSEIRASMSHPVNTQVAAPIVEHKKTVVKTDGGLSIKDVMRHVAQTTRVGR